MHPFGVPAPNVLRRISIGRASVSVTVVVCMLGWVAGWLALGRARTVPELMAHEHHDRPTRDGLAGVQVIVPARDEGHNVGALLAALLADDGTGAPDRVVVVDDHSSDDTAAVAASFPGVEVVTCAPLPEGWTGKSWACATGVQHVLAAGAGPDAVYVFLDADVRAGAAALAAVVRHRDRVGGIVSVQPYHLTRRPYEQLSALFNVVAVMGTAMGDQRREPTGAFGPVLVSSREDYERVGGHASVAPAVVEDLALAARYRDAGLTVSAFEGRRAIRFRMYPGGLAQLAEGWTKNFAVGAGATPLLRLAAIVWWVTTLGSAALALADGLLGRIPLVTGLVLYAAFVVQLRVMFSQVGRFGSVTAVLFPLPLLFFLVVFLRSLWRTHVRQSVTWRGRAVSTARSRH